jgi:hypothetical protein
MIVYKLKLPFIEQYKVQKDELWPWEEDQKNWDKLIYKSIIGIILNNVIT